MYLKNYANSLHIQITTHVTSINGQALRTILLSALSKYHEVDWVGGGTLHGAMWHHSFFNNKKPFNLLDYNENIGHVVSNFVKDGKYDIAIFSTYSMCSLLSPCLNTSAVGTV